MDSVNGNIMSKILRKENVYKVNIARPYLVIKFVHELHGNLLLSVQNALLNEPNELSDIYCVSFPNVLFYID